MQRWNLFRETTATDVAEAFASYWRERGRPLVEVGEEWDRLDVHQEDHGWVAVQLGVAWDWKESCKAHLQVSRQLGRAGFLVFANDDGSWGYEFFESGRSLDHFVRKKGTVPLGFPAKGCPGNAAQIAVRLPFVDAAAVAACLIQEEAGATVPANGMVDFLQALGVRSASPVARTLFRKR